MTACVAQLSDAAMEFLLQKVLMVLTLLHRRASGSLQPAQLQALAHTCFLALRAADTCEVSLCMGCTEGDDTDMSSSHACRYRERSCARYR